MGTLSKYNTALGFTVSAEILREIDRQAKCVGKRRSEFVASLLEWCLDVHNEDSFMDRVSARVTTVIGNMLKGSPQVGDDKLVQVQCVLSKELTKKIDIFANGLKLSRVNALATLVEIALPQTAFYNPLVMPGVKVVRQLKKNRADKAVKGLPQ